MTKTLRERRDEIVRLVLAIPVDDETDDGPLELIGELEDLLDEGVPYGGGVHSFPGHSRKGNVPPLTIRYRWNISARAWTFLEGLAWFGGDVAFDNTCEYMELVPFLTELRRAGVVRLQPRQETMSRVTILPGVL